MEHYNILISKEQLEIVRSALEHFDSLRREMGPGVRPDDELALLLGMVGDTLAEVPNPENTHSFVD